MSDYVKLYRALGVKVGLCEIQGRRPSQEDCLQVGIREIKDFPQLNVNDQNAVLMQTFAELQKKFGQSKYAGSTCCTVTAWIEPLTNTVQVSTANLGDSTAYLIIIDEVLESVVQAKKINDWHNPDPDINYSEYERVAAFALPARHENYGPLRLNGELAVTRGFGDKYYEQFGLSHIPDVINTQKTLSGSQKAYIVLGCDGLTEKRVVINNRGQHVQKAALSVDGIANIVNTMRRKRSLDLIAEHLVDSAYVNGSHDNISVAVFAVTPTPTAAVICDGHNGLISRNIGENFYPLLESHIRQRILLNGKPKIVEEIKRKTTQYLASLTVDIVAEILKSDTSRKVLIKKLALDSSLSNKALLKLTVETDGDEVDAFITKFRKSATLKTVTSKQLSNLITEYGYAKVVMKIMQHADAVKALNKIGTLFKDSNIKRYLEKKQGYWGWLMQKPGWSKGQRLLKFPNPKTRRKIADLDLTRKMVNKR